VEGNRKTTNEVISTSFLTTSQCNGEQTMKTKFVIYITGLQNMNPLLGGGTAVMVLSAYFVCIGFFLISSLITIGIMLLATVSQMLCIFSRL
jgi:hypothetical protein